MTPVLLSNPGLPLAVYGNPVRRGRKRRRNPVFLGPKAGMWATNPVGLGNKAGMWATNPSIKKSLSKRFPGWRVTSIRPVKTRRNPRKATMARTRLRRSKTTGRFLSRRARKFQRRRARFTVGRTYRRKGAWVKVQRAHIRRRKGRKISNRAVKWSGRKGKIVYSGIGGRKGRKGIRRMRFTNPRRRRGRSRRRNPSAVRSYTRGLTTAPGEMMNVLRKFNLQKGLSVSVGALATYVAGGIASRFAAPIIAQIPVIGTSPMAARVIGAAFPYTAAFLAAQAGFLGKHKHTVMLGGAVASILELIMPGRVGAWFAQIPGVTSIPGFQGLAGLGGLSGAANELCGYVQAPSYAGVGQADALAGYVQAPSYAGVGQADALAGYVQAPSYAGVGNADYLVTDDYVPKSSYLN